MEILALDNMLQSQFQNTSMYGFAPLEDELAASSGCRCALVTLMPYPDLTREYSPQDFYIMLEDLRSVHTAKLNAVKSFLEESHVTFAAPPATPKDDGEYRADFSYKWAALQAGLGFIGKNDVFVHHRYAQRVRISCLLLDLELPLAAGDITSKCGNCELCVKACPHGYISGRSWHRGIHREELVDYRQCATKSLHSQSSGNHLCAHCLLACIYPYI